jgi:hypothetical protein
MAKLKKPCANGIRKIGKRSVTIQTGNQVQRKEQKWREGISEYEGVKPGISSYKIKNHVLSNVIECILITEKPNNENEI